MFDLTPILIFIYGTWETNPFGNIYYMRDCVRGHVTLTTGNTRTVLIWEETKLSWFNTENAQNQLNTSGKKH